MNTLKIHPTSIDTRVLSGCRRNARRRTGDLPHRHTLCHRLRRHIAQGHRSPLPYKGINPQKNALAVVCHDFSQASEFARIDNRAFAIMRRYLPGPFTFILPSSPSMPKIFKGRKQVGIRIPDNDVARELARSLGTPLLTTSLPSDGLEPEEITEPGEIELRAEAMGVDMLIDAGSGSAIPSAVIDLTDSSAPVVLREGPVEFEF